MDVFVARQPVFDRSEKVFGYRLQFRSSLESYLEQDGADEDALKALADAFFLFGIESIARGRRAFLTFDRRALVGRIATLLPKDALVVTLHESVEPDEEVLAACQELRRAGYRIALDGLALLGKPDEFIRQADIVRADFSRLTSRSRSLLAQVFTPLQIKLVATNVETHEDFAEAIGAGYALLEGAFFCEPVILATGDVPTNKLTALRLLQEIHRSPMRLDKVDALIRHDVALTYKLLRYINSAWFGLRHKISAVRQALLMLGEIGTRKWASVAVMSGMSDDRPLELVTSSVVRARFGELLAEHVGLPARGEDLFLTGLFSFIDVLVGRPMAEVLEELPLGQEVRNTLLGADTALQQAYQFVLAYERGHWERVNRLATQLDLDERLVPDLYRRAVESGNEAAAANLRQTATARAS